MDLIIGKSRDLDKIFDLGELVLFDICKYIRE